MVEGITQKIPVNKIISVSDRTHGGLGELEILAQSIAELGLINPVSVKETDNGAYRVIAGRRRVEAAKMLGWADIEAKVYPTDADNEAIALTENVNRQEMHPLDEAEHFKKLLGKISVKEIAANYDRSVAAIHHRVRLCGLAPELKTMFREGKLNITGAALIASLPEKDQERFFNKFQNRGHISIYDIQDFVQRVQRCVLEHIVDADCDACKKRTHNTGEGLFDELTYLQDVCFDGECYCKKWCAKIESLIEEAGAADTEKIFFAKSVPGFYPQKTNSLSIGGKDYPLLAEGKNTFKPTKSKAAKGTAWYISVWQNKLKAERMGFKAFAPPTYNSQSREEDPVVEFMLDKLPDMGDEERKTAAAVLAEKYKYGKYSYYEQIKKPLLACLIERRLEKGVTANTARLYLESECGESDFEGAWREFRDEEDRELFSKTTGFESLADIPKNALAQKLFLFFVLRSINERDLPNINESEEGFAESERSLTWKFIGITREEYEALYREKLKDAVSELTGVPDKPNGGGVAPEKIPASGRSKRRKA